MTDNISHFKTLVHPVFSDCLRNNSKQLFKKKVIHSISEAVMPDVEGTYNVTETVVPHTGVCHRKAFRLCIQCNCSLVLLWCYCTVADQEGKG